MAGRRCPGTDLVDGRNVACPVVLVRRERRCARHAREYEARRGTPAARGYSSPHTRLRAAWQRRLDAGEVVLCADGCGTRVDPASWDLGHDHDHERGGWLGPMVPAHNRGEGGRRGALLGGVSATP